MSCCENYVRKFGIWYQGTRGTKSASSRARLRNNHNNHTAPTKEKKKERLPTPHGYEIQHRPILGRPVAMRPWRLDEAQPVQPAVPRLRAGRHVVADGAVGPVENLLAGRGQEGLVEFRGDAPGGTVGGHGFRGRELEADEAAGGGEEGDGAKGPLGAG